MKTKLEVDLQDAMEKLTATMSHDETTLLRGRIGYIKLLLSEERAAALRQLSRDRGDNF